ncbi:hypothetical protein [Psychrobacter proteolyticus]|uniref:hypothetical protein n=1 Tax=Psychrobacter proteolyticus TaxID=147825 RepID=UPI00223468C2|nr:hypothetical protein [Psychrobacter proteolyticus]
MAYDNIPSVLPHLQVSMDYDDTADLTHEMKLALVDNGYMEAISFSFSDAKLEALLDDEALGEVLALANPISVIWPLCVVPIVEPTALQCNII